MSSTQGQVRSKIDFPPPRSRHAPKTFSGRYDEVDSFLKEFENLAKTYGLSNDDRFDYVLRYVKRSVREIIEGLQEFADKDWTVFADTLRSLFDHAKLDKRFKEKDLTNFISKSRKGRIQSLYDFHKYQRKFTRIGGWLHQKKKINDQEYRKYFWKGIPRVTQKKLEDRMLQVNPKLPRSDPFPIDVIISAADHIFDISRFYDEDSEDSIGEDSEDEDDTSSSEEEDSSSEESDSETEKKKSKAKPKKKFRAKPKVKDEPISHPPSTTSKYQKDTDEVADLIDKLQRLNLSDPGYAALYFRIISKAPNTSGFLTKPRQRAGESSPRTNASTTSPSQPANNGTFECFFCGEQGHGLRRCAQADVMIKAGTIIRSTDGRITWPDATTILRNGSETILSAINRELAFRSRIKVDRPASTNVIREASPMELTYPADATDYEESDEENEKVETLDHGLVYAQELFPVVRTKDAKKEKTRASRFDGVFPPPLSRPTAPLSKDKEKKPNPDPIAAMLPPPQFYEGEVVIKTHNTDSDDDNIIEDVIMEDATLDPASKRIKRKEPSTQRQDKAPKIPKLPKPITSTPHILPRLSPPVPVQSRPQSQCQKDFDSQDLFKKICGTPITISLQQILGSSPTMAKQMQEYLRVTRLSNKPQVNTIGRATLYDPIDARLISLRMTFENDYTVDTLIDCGSELDIINRQTCIKAQLPINTSLTTYMRDAGQHDTIMHGKCHGINLKAGNLVTTTDLWVGNKVPFSLLLGRPWQRRNRISIDERETGTWLCRRNPHGDIIWEACVVPARHAEDFLNSAHFFGQSPPSPDILIANMTLNLEQDDQENKPKI